MQECLFYKKTEGGGVKCEACSHFCLINPGKVGLCGVRQNFDGKLYSLVYGRAISLNIDPIEKKPIYHFLPGSRTLSLGTLGCNFSCYNCQNYEISQIYEEKGNTAKYEGINWGHNITPEEIVREALVNNCPSISYTYNEPSIFVEYALETMKLARAKGLKNIWVSNGYMSDLVLDEVVPFLDAINVDLKSFNNEFYKKYCGAELAPVLKNLKKLAQSDVSLEVTTLIIPGLTDDLEMLEDLIDFIKNDLGRDAPWHISAFSPYISWKLKDLSATPHDLIYKIKEMGIERGLKNVYVGNI
jgi:pyruvate formate lyase activating enzyme